MVGGHTTRGLHTQSSLLPAAFGQNGIVAHPPSAQRNGRSKGQLLLDQQLRYLLTQLGHSILEATHLPSGHLNLVGSQRVLAEEGQVVAQEPSPHLTDLSAEHPL